MDQQLERRRAAVATLAVLAATLLAQACGLQAGAGLRSTGDPRQTSIALETSGRLHRARGSGPYGAWASTMTFSELQPVTVRSLAFGAGYRIVANPYLRLEIGPELGFGTPATLHYVNTALFTGGVAGVLVRIPVLGDQDNLQGFAPVGYALDLVLLGRGGRWTPGVADSGVGTWEMGGELGLRFTFFSDLLVAVHDSWEEPWDEP